MTGKLKPRKPNPGKRKSPQAKPLDGVRVLVGRARRQASALSTALERLGADVIEIPFIEIHQPRSFKPLDAALKNIAQYDWLILTSVNGVDAVHARLRRLRIPVAQLAHLQIAAIGPSTGKEIEKLGLKVSLVPPQYVAESVVESLRDRVRGKRILLARAKVARDVIPRGLRKLGAKVEVVEVYETVVPSGSKRKLQSLMRYPERRPRIVTFTSSSSARNFVELIGGRHAWLEGVKLVSIGPVTSATLRQFRLPVDAEASEYTIPGLSRAVVNWVRKVRPGN